MTILLALLLAVQDDVKKIDEWVAEQLKDPGAPPASRLYYLKALEATLRGIPEAAEYGYGKALEEDSEFAAAANGRGFAYLRAGNPERAAELLARDAEKFPDDWSILHNLGTAQHERKKYDEAVRWYDRAAGKAGHPQESAESHAAKGASLVELKKWDEALGSFRSAIEFDPLRDSARERIAIIQAYLWRKNPPQLDPAKFLGDYVVRLSSLRADAQSLAERIGSAIDRYLKGMDRIVAQEGRDLRKMEELFRQLERGDLPEPDSRFDPGCADKPLGTDPDSCAFRDSLEILRYLARDVTAWAYAFGHVGGFGAAEEWAEMRREFREELRRTYVTCLTQYADRCTAILGILDRVRAKPDEAGIEEAAKAMGEVPIMARIVFLWRRWMDISVPALERAWEQLLGTAEDMASQEDSWVGLAHKLHREWHGGKPGFEYALKRLCAINDARCARIHRKLDGLYRSNRARGESHLKRYREAFAKDVEQIDDWYAAPLRLQGNYKALYETLRLSGGSLEKSAALFDSHLWGTIGPLMSYPKIACFVCSHACGHKNYQKIRYLPFDITFSLCGTFTFKFGAEGEMELKMGRGLFGSVYFNPAKLDFGARIGAEYRGADLTLLRDPTNPDFTYYHRMGHLPTKAKLFGGPKEFMVPGKVYWVPEKPKFPWGPWGQRTVRAKQPDPKWSCGISLSAIPSVYVDFNFNPEGTNVSLKGKLRGRAEIGGALGVIGGSPSAETTIWQLYASPSQGDKK